MTTSASLSSPPIDVAGYDPLRDAGDCTWDVKAASHAVDFFPACCTHTKGFSGQFDLAPWQRDIVATLYGWKRPDGTRRYREAFVAVPRKNGKTTLVAGLALYNLRCDGEHGPEVYCAAYSRDQATLVFDPAATMVRANSMMSRSFVIHESVKRIVSHGNGGFMRAIPAESASSHGFNASTVIFDELHTQANRSLYDVLKTSQGARKQPLFISITTAGHDRHSICWEVWDYARRVRDGIIEDPYFLPVIYELQEGENWEDKEVWRRVNPNYGISVSQDYLDEAYSRACEIISYQNTFRNLHLNEWTEQATRWFSMDKWDESSGEIEIPYGAECWAGLDLSTTTDVSALVLMFPLGDAFAIKPFFWVPAESALARERRDRVPYRQWAQGGFIEMTPGVSVDYDQIRADINQLREQYNIRTIAVDRWNATQLVKQLDGDGFDVGLFGQGYASMTGPAKHLEKLIAEAALRHGGHPVLRWMAGNVAIEQDAAGNIKPSKAKSTERIDGIVALVMALGVWATSDVAWNSAEIGL